MKVTNVALLCAFGWSGAIAQSGSTTIGGFSGSHTALPRWCGKPYESGSPNYDPGGRLSPPSPTKFPNVHLRIQPHHSIYDSSEKTAEFIVVGKARHGNDHPWHYGSTAPSSQLAIKIELREAKRVLASGMIKTDSVKHLVQINLDSLKPRLEPYDIVLHASSVHSTAKQSYTATTELYYLPSKRSGSTVKIDNLHGGMLVANNVTNYAFEPLLPFGFYTSCSGYLNYSLTNVSAYKSYGFNAINPVCAFTDGNLDYLYDWMDEVNLWYQYDMRNSYLNLTSVEEQIPLLKDRSNLLSWYTADEPDGWQYALNSTRLAYNLLKSKDPYHPTALVLNCQNYFFEEYTSGTDYIMEDAYPVSIDPNFSRKFNTPCNETYGDCGCDNCKDSLKDVSDRLDDFANYAEWLGIGEKPLWAVLQAFSGEQYWARDPTPQETWVMMILGLNHKAKAMMSWTFPASSTLNDAHGKMAKVVTQRPTSQFLLGGDPTILRSPNHPLLDVSYWTQGNRLLVAVANTNYNSSDDVVSIPLPHRARKITGHLWGSTAWSIDGSGKLSSDRLAALASDILILE